MERKDQCLFSLGSNERSGACKSAEAIDENFSVYIAARETRDKYRNRKSMLFTESSMVSIVSSACLLEHVVRDHTDFDGGYALT